jgi:hypothetical protein
MKKIIILVVFTVALVACRNSADTEMKDNPTNPAPIVPQTQSTSTTVPTTVPTTTTQPNPIQMVVPTSPTTTTTTASNLNPPHGQPGHRCDLDVGAPLDSKPTTKVVSSSTSPTVTTTTSPQVSTQSQAPVVTAPGMNPPHGQPGHRCDIAVGAPLNSKPGTTAPTVNSMPLTPVKQN